MAERRIEAPLVAHRVIDGDTLEASLGVRLPVRLAGIDTPELSVAAQKTAATVAKAHARRWLAESDRRGLTMLARVEELGQYGRLVGDIIRPATGETLAAYLLAAGVAVPSDGTRRHQWTDEELRRIEKLAP